MATITAPRRELRNWITDHALQRFRDRTGAVELRALPDADVARIVDELVATAEKVAEVEDLSDGPEHPQRTTVATFADRSGQVLHAVMRPPGVNPNHLRPRGVGPRDPAMIVITILKADMVDFSYATGRWRPLHPVNTPFAEPLRRLVVVAAPSATIATPDAPGRLAEGTHGGRTAAAWATEDARKARAREILRAEPGISLSGADGLEARLRAQFGIGMSWEVMSRMREEVRAGAPVAPRSHHRAPEDLIVEAAPPAPSSTRSIGERLTDAIAAEAAAKAALREAEGALARARAAVDDLMAAVVAARG